ncbi:hypothetical protein IG631_13860 [Alternaria alternata]|nr:hypothetical protein IG631_13860 [Alternaria alternata]
MLVVYQDCDLKRLGDSLFVRDVRRIYRVEFVCIGWNGFSVRCDSLVPLRHGYTVDVHWRNVHGRATGTIEDYQKEPMASADDAYRIGPRFIVACFASVISNFWCTFGTLLVEHQHSVACKM